MEYSMSRVLAALAHVAALLTTVASTDVYAKHGKDDPVGHVRGEGPGHR